MKKKRAAPPKQPSTSAHLADSQLATDTTVPTVDVDAPLKIEEAATHDAPPSVDANAPLAVENIPALTQDVPLERHNRVIFAAAVAGLVLVSLGALGSYGLYQKYGRITAVIVPTLVPTISAPTHPPAFSKIGWTFAVLNGSGIAGSAGKTADTLRSMGYEVASAGNADKTNYKGINVFIAPKNVSYRQELLLDLSREFASATYSGELTDATVSAQIIVGR